MLWIVILFAAAVAAIWVTSGLIRLGLMLLVAGFVGWLAGQIVSGKRSYGWLGATLAGLVGSWLGHALLGPVGPALFGVRLVPAFLGALILAFLAQVLARRA